MILTHKIRHNRDFTTELRKARQVAEFAIMNRDKLSSKHVKQFGLKSTIANQILRKYGRNKKIQKVSRVNLVIPNQSVRFEVETKQISVPCLSLVLDGSNLRPFTKINQVEVSGEYAFVAITVAEEPITQPSSWVGVDRNTTGHCLVAANPATGKVLKLGSSANHVHHKYSKMRKRFQRKGKLKLVKKIKNRESRIIRDLNHKISKKVVDYAVETKAGIVLEDLKGIRKSKNQAKSFKYALNSWSHFQLGQFIEYKAKLRGVIVTKIDPRYTSQQCSKCGLLGIRKGKIFKCPHCGHIENADVNAAFVIALRHTGVLQLPADRDVGNGSTDAPQGALA